MGQFKIYDKESMAKKKHKFKTRPWFSRKKDTFQEKIQGERRFLDYANEKKGFLNKKAETR